MKKKQIVVLTIFLTFLSIASVSTILSMNFAYTAPVIREYEPYDGTPLLEGKTYEGARLSTFDADTSVPWVVTVSDDWTGEMYSQEFNCVLEGEKCNIWIGLSPDVWNDTFYDYYDPMGEGFEDDTWYFAYPWSAAGINAEAASAPDPDGDEYYLPPGYVDWVTGEQLMSIRDEFDNNIHDAVVAHFGDYEYRPGPMDDGKIQVLIFNIRDGLFYDPIGAGWFIIGYFWSYVSNLNNANIFHMDTYQWWRRAGTPTETHYGLGPLPLQYEGTFAHEFQHLVHHDVDSDEVSFVNEGCSTLAEWICGYGFSPGHISEYLIYHWDDSLTVWQGYLSDYGGVFLFTYYMWEHYGEDELIWDLTHEQANGIDGWNAVLEGRTGKSFDDIFEEWTIANYLDDTDLGKDGVYGYYGLDIPSDDTGGYSIPLVMEMWQDSNPSFFHWIIRGAYGNGECYPYGATLPYAANYVKFYQDGGVNLLELTFDGDDYTGVTAYSGEYKMSSNGDAWAWYRFHQAFDLTSLPSATLTFMTSYAIERDWDYGYVEVHDLTMDTWCTLEGLTTTDTLTNNYGIYNDNCPDELEPTTYYDAGCWYAFTGSNGGWTQEVMDLTPFAGHEIEIFFTYWTDPYTLEAGMFVDDIDIPELGVFDNLEGATNWVIDNGWTCDNNLHYNDFEVNLITVKNTYHQTGELKNSFTSIRPVGLDDTTELGTANFVIFGNQYVEQYVVMVIANQPGYSHTFTTSYTWRAVKTWW